ncbi:MAG TPA: hypothetical protein VID48_10580 [Solirubrobacteraceae bacterium]
MADVTEEPAAAVEPPVVAALAEQAPRAEAAVANSSTIDFADVLGVITVVAYGVS